MDAETTHLNSADFARQTYEMAARAYTAEQSMQGHLWSRWRDAVQLLTIVGTGHGAAILMLANKSLHPYLVVPGALIAMSALVLLAWAAIQLGKVFQGDDYSDQIPAETLKVLETNGPEWALSTLHALAAQMFRHAGNNYGINHGRTQRLSRARAGTLVSLYLLFPAWGAVFLVKLLHAAIS